MALRHWLELSLTDGVGPILIGRMVAHAGSAEAALSLPLSELRLIEGIGTSKATAIHESLKHAPGEAERQLAMARETGARIISRDDDDYPELLAPYDDSPIILYVQGTLEARDLLSLAIVGSRRCSHYGREQADRFAALLAGAGITVVSGGARGVDSAAHRGALSHPQGRTLAVLGSGLDVHYPPENLPLFKQIARQGAVITEFPFGTPPNQENFPRRNRIVSGLSRGVLVIEAPKKSGALITARIANEDHGRPVFALPGRVDNDMSYGPHQLIRDGAILTTGIEDILAELCPVPHAATQPALFDGLDLRVDPQVPLPSPGTPGEGREGVSFPPADASPQNPPPQPTPSLPLSDRQRLLLQHLSKDPATVDQLIDRTALDPAAILGDLTFLSLKGLVKRVDGQTFIRRKGI